MTRLWKCKCGFFFFLGRDSFEKHALQICTCIIGRLKMCECDVVFNVFFNSGIVICFVYVIHVIELFWIKISVDLVERGLRYVELFNYRCNVIFKM